MKDSGTACGKIILSGEYAVVFGYPGIAVPAPFAVTVTWTNGSPSPSLAPARFTLSRGERETRHHDLTVRYTGVDNEAYLHRIIDEVQKYTDPLHGHLTIENTIPIGRGMGSSTALVIAICRCLLSHPPLLFKGEDKGEGYKQIALSIEDTVNPGHSGLDFEVIWNEKPILFQKDKPTKILDIPINLLMGTCSSTVLIDTGEPNETTAEMIAWVKKNSLSPRERARVRGSLQAIAHCTERLITGESPLTVFPDHHRAQIALGVVPKPVQALITDVEKAGGAAKVVGAGGRSSEGTKIPSEARSAEPREGGGIVLALHQKPAKLLIIAKQHNMPTFALTQTHPYLPFTPLKS